MQKTPFAPIFAHVAKQFNLDPRLLMAIARQESGFDSQIVSKAGAQGVMQLMPDTAKALGVDDPFDPVQNIAGGAAYFSGLMERFDGDVEKALAGYNWGPNRKAFQKENWKDFLPEETANYLPAVMSQVEQFEAPGIDPSISPSQATQRLTPESPESVKAEEANPLDKQLRDIQTKFPQAADYLREAEKPPKVEDLGRLNRSMLEMGAKRLGAEPQDILNRSWELVQQEAVEAQQAVAGGSAEGGSGPTSSDPRRFFSDLSAARLGGVAFKGSSGLGSTTARSKTKQSPAEDEEFLGDIFAGIGGSGFSEERPPPDVEIAPHPRGGGEFPMPNQSRAAADRLRRLISQRMAKRRQRLSQQPS